MADIKPVKDASQAASDGVSKVPEISAADRRCSGLNLLRQFDEAPLQALHVKAAVITGVGFIAEGFVRFLVQTLGPMFAFGLYPKLMMLPDKRNVQMTWMGVLGLVVGRWFFGRTADRVGRLPVYSWTTVLMAFALIFVAVASFGSADVVMTFILLSGLILAIAIGGEYATAPVITSEYAPRRYRGALIAFSYSLQLVGYIFAACTTLVITHAMRPAIFKCRPTQKCDAIRNLWRVMAVGAIPGLVTFYLCSFLPETPRYLVHIVQPRLTGISAGHAASPEQPDALILPSPPIGPAPRTPPPPPPPPRPS